MEWNVNRSMPRRLSASRDAYLQRLGAHELVETRGRDVKASDNLFD
jgi:hypothetical protein